MCLDTVKPFALHFIGEIGPKHMMNLWFCLSIIVMINQAIGHAQHHRIKKELSICQSLRCPCQLSFSMLSQIKISYNGIVTRGPILLPWCNLNPSMDYHIPSKVWDETTKYQMPNLNRYAGEIWKFVSTLIQHFIMSVITFRCWEYC